MICSKKGSTINILNVCKILLFFFCIASMPLSLFSAELITGDRNAAIGETFSFPVGAYAINTTGECLYTTALNSGGGEYTLARVKRDKKEFSPLTPEYVSINGQTDQDNPLFNVGIKYLHLLENKRDRVINTYPILVSNTEPTKIYVVDLVQYRGKLYRETKHTETREQDKKNTKENIEKQDQDEKNLKEQDNNLEQKKDICSRPTSRISLAVFASIVDTNLNPISSIDAIAADTVGHIFAAIAPQAGAFGDPGSAIAVLRFINFRDIDKKSEGKNDKVEQDLESLEKKEKIKNGQVRLEDNNQGAKINMHDDLKKKKEKEKKEDLFFMSIFPEIKKTEKNNQDKVLEEGKGREKKEKEKKRKSFDGTKQFNAALDLTSALAKIGNDLQSMEVSDMYWDNALQCLFVALKVQAGVGVSDGCKALVVGKLKSNGALILQNIAPDNVFVNENEIVGAVGSGAQVSLHKVRTMYSSNRLPYVIVLGGNGDSSSTKKSVYALPLVKNPKEDTQGTLANKNGLPEDQFEGKIIKRFYYRYFKDAATTNADLLTSNSQAAQVGAGNLAYDISEIFVIGDAVFALVQPQNNNGGGNLYMSRALFDENGKIKRWTQWQFVSSSTNPLYGIGLDASYGNFLLLSGDALDNVKTIKRTLWSLGDENGVRDLSVVMGKEFPKDKAGIQGLFEFPYSSQGVPYGLENITLMVATGYKKVVLAELAQVNAGNLVRNTGDFSSSEEIFTEGKITKNFPVDSTRVISISGGDLNKLGPIEAAIVTLQSTGTSVNNRLFVGGVGGVAVLVDSNGDGWTVGLGPSFAGLTDDMAFKLVGDFVFVRKLVQEGDYLFILTDDILYRVDLTSESNDLANGVLDYVEIANVTNIPGLCEYSTFTDFVVTDSLGILATSYGLFRIGDGKDIKTDTSETGLDWTQVTIPAYSGPVKQLFTVSQTLKEQDVSSENLDGVLYVLCSYQGKDFAQFNRFTVNYSESVGPNMILPLPDYFVIDPQTGTGSHACFVNYGTFRDLLRDEGALRYSSADRDICISPLLKLLPQGLVFGLILPIVGSKTVSLSIENDSDLVKILRSSTGPLFVAGDFGLKVNE